MWISVLIEGAVVCPQAVRLSEDVVGVTAGGSFMRMSEPRQ
jgi:hypothetical protein